MKLKNLHLKLITLTICMFIVSSGFSQNCPSGIVALWNLDDSSGDVFMDAIGAHNATSENSISTVDGIIGNAKHLSGTQYMSAADHADFDFTANSSFSAECWVKLSSYTAAYSQVIIGKKDGLAGGTYWFIGILNSNGKVIWEIKDSQGVTRTLFSPSALSLNTWHHIVGVRDEATNANNLYIDGILAVSTTYDYVGNFSSDGAVIMGAFPDGSGIPAYFLDGDLDEVAIYNRAITLVDVTEHMQESTYGLSYCDPYSPVIKSTPTTTAIVGKPYLYTVQASGMPTISYSLLSGHPAGMTIDNVTGAISWTPASAAENAYVKVRANNNIAPADTQEFRVFLAEAPTNCPDNVSFLLKLNETSGPTYADYYVNHTGAATVAPIPTTGIVNGAQTFGATTGIVIPDLGNEFEWDYNDNFSIELWMKTATAKTMVMIGRRRLSVDNPDKARWWLGTNSSGYPTFSLRDNAATPNTVDMTGIEPESVADDQWHHIVAVRTGSRMKLYVDGVKVNDLAATFDGFIMDVETPISVGYWYPQNSSQTLEDQFHYTGALDEVAIFNVALTDAQVTAFYNGGAPAGHCAIDNYAPVITSTPVTDATEEVIYAYNFTIEDIDASDVISLSAVTKPTWLSFTYTAGQKSAVLSATPTNDNVGNHSILLRVSDGSVTRDQSFTLAVANVNDAPLITSTPVLTGRVGIAYTYTLTATDVDANTTLTLSAVGALPAGLLFDETSGVLSGTPTQAGTFDVILRVSDGTVNVDQNFAITVAPSTAISDLEAAGISIYPVPAREYLTVKLGSVSDETELEVISITGSVIKIATVQANQQEYTLELHGIEPGAYYLRIKNNSINTIGKFIITR